MPLSDQRRPSISLDVAHNIFFAVAGQQISCQLCCVRAGNRIEIQARQNQLRIFTSTCPRRRVDMFLANTLSATGRKEMPRLSPHSARSPFCLYTRIMLVLFHCCGRHLADQQSRIKLCSLLCKAHQPYLMTSARMLSGPAALLFLRMIMAFSTSSMDGGSSSLGMICRVGRPSRKSGSVVWILFSRFCKYSAHLSRINSLFLIKTTSVHLTGCMKKRLGP